MRQTESLYNSFSLVAQEKWIILRGILTGDFLHLISKPVRLQPSITRMCGTWLQSPGMKCGMRCLKLAEVRALFILNGGGWLEKFTESKFWHKEWQRALGNVAGRGSMRPAHLPVNLVVAVFDFLISSSLLPSVHQQWWKATRRSGRPCS